jgi:quercetin dioxygenase-like cupin family protein
MRVYRSDVKRWTEGKGYRKRTLLEEGELGIEGSFIQEVEFVAGDKVPRHYHRTQTEIFYALSPIGFEINGERVLMQPGDIVVCEPGDVHGNPSLPQAARILVIKVDFAEDDTIWLEP